MTLLRNQQHISWFNQNMDTLFSANVSGPFIDHSIITTIKIGPVDPYISV